MCLEEQSPELETRQRECGKCGERFSEALIDGVCKGTPGECPFCNYVNGHNPDKLIVKGKHDITPPKQGDTARKDQNATATVLANEPRPRPITVALVCWAEVAGWWLAARQPENPESWLLKGSSGRKLEIDGECFPTFEFRLKLEGIREEPILVERRRFDIADSDRDIVKRSIVELSKDIALKGCDKCGGKGWVQVRAHHPEWECDKCGGEGVVWYVIEPDGV